MVRNIDGFTIVVAPAKDQLSRPNWFYGILLHDNKVLRGVYGDYAGCIRVLYAEMSKHGLEVSDESETFV